MKMKILEGWEEFGLVGTGFGGTGGAIVVAGQDGGVLVSPDSTCVI